MYLGWFPLVLGLNKLFEFSHRVSQRFIFVCLILGFLQLLQEAGIMVTYIYSSLDQTARKINVAKFVNKKVMVMIVTDVAVSLSNML